MNAQVLTIELSDGSSLLINLEEGQGHDYVQKNISKILTEKDEDPNLIIQWKILSQEEIIKHDPDPTESKFLTQSGQLHKKEIDKQKEQTEDDKLHSRFGEFMSNREWIFADLDESFVRSLESEDPTVKHEVIRKKEFYRDLPVFIKKWGFWGMSLEEALKFNPFGNILKIEITNKGSGYSSEPIATFSEPLKEYGGGGVPIVETKIENGELIDIIIIDPGHGYGLDPKITISEPESKEGTRAEAISEAWFFYDISEPS